MGIFDMFKGKDKGAKSDAKEMDDAAKDDSSSDSDNGDDSSE